MELLTTGVDVPAVRNIAFFRYMKSPISFYQMIDRGTRIDEPTGKLMFTVYDYAGATRLFGLPFVSKPKGPEGPTDGGDGPGPEPPPPLRPVIVDGFEVAVNSLGQFIVGSVGGQAMPIAIDDYKAGLSARLIAECPTLEDFRARWVVPPDREEMIRVDRRRGLLAERVAHGRADERLRSVRRARRCRVWLARRLWRQHLASMWSDITHVEFCEFRPSSPDRYLAGSDDEGTLVMWQAGQPQSWAALLAQARELDKSKLPDLLWARRELIPYLPLLFPYRLTSTLASAIDTIAATPQG